MPRSAPSSSTAASRTSSRSAWRSRRGGRREAAAQLLEADHALDVGPQAVGGQGQVLVGRAAVGDVHGHAEQAAGVVGEAVGDRADPPHAVLGMPDPVLADQGFTVDQGVVEAGQVGGEVVLVDDVDERGEVVVGHAEQGAGRRPPGR